MRLLSLLPQSLLLFSTLSAAASSWTFADGSLTVSSKGSAKDGGVKEKYVHENTLPGGTVSPHLRFDSPCI